VHELASLADAVPNRYLGWALISVAFLIDDPTLQK
jgi:hypothetical protein